jgi:hypothetical protein
MTRMLDALGTMRWPFVAGAAALVLLGLLLGPVIFTDTDFGGGLLLGVVSGALASAVLYAVLRGMAQTKHSG